MQLKNKLLNLVILSFLYSAVFFATYQLIRVLVSMRPVADDYCIAGTADIQIFRYFSYWYTTFIADFATLLGNYFLIAIPSVYLPFGIGNSITFIAYMISLTFIFYKFLNPKLDSKKKKLYFFLLLFYFIFMSWISYWFVLGRGNSGDLISRGSVGDLVFFGAVMTWQAANVNYVLLPIIGLLIYLKMFSNEFRKMNPLLAVFLGLIIGGSFYVLGTVFILLFTASTLFQFFGDSRVSIKAFSNEMILIISAIISISVSYFSPGARLRRLNYPQEVNLGKILETSIDAAFDWGKTLYLPAILVTLLLGALIYRALSYLLKSDFEPNFSNLVLTPLILSFLTFVVTKVAELFSYKAWWHELSSRTFLFLGTLTLGSLLMKYLINEYTLKFSLFELLVSLLIIFIGMYSVKQSGDLVADRMERWEMGPAQVTPNMDPLDRETAWVYECWKQLVQIKNSHPV